MALPGLGIRRVDALLYVAWLFVLGIGSQSMLPIFLNFRPLWDCEGVGNFSRDCDLAQSCQGNLSFQVATWRNQSRVQTYQTPSSQSRRVPLRRYRSLWSLRHTPVADIGFHPPRPNFLAFAGSSRILLMAHTSRRPIPAPWRSSAYFAGSERTTRL